jgi:hypothetical protein
MVIIWGSYWYFGRPGGNITLELTKPIQHEYGYCWVVSLPQYAGWADTRGQQQRSPLMVYENGRALGPAHAIHDSLRNMGQGRLSHWGDKLYFSTSDNSDPNTNGRHYAIKGFLASATVPLGRTTVYVVLSLVLAGGILGLILMAVLSRNPLVMKWLIAWAVMNGGILVYLYLNMVSPVSWGGRSSYVLIFAGLLILFASLFLIHHEVFSQRGFSSRGRRAYTMATLWAGLGIAALLLEVFFRITPVYDTLSLNPGVKFFWPDYVYVNLNNLGYRDRDFTTPKKPGAYRILAVGDSFTEGSGCRREETFARILERDLNRRLQAANCPEQVEVYNLGHCGANTVEEVQTIFREVPVLQPDLIIMAYYLNDAETNPPDIKTFNPPPWVDAMHKIFMEEVRSYAYYWLFTNFTWFHGPVSSWHDYFLAINRSDYHGWQVASKEFSRLSKYLQETKTDFLAIIFPDFLQKNYPPEFRLIHQQVCRMIQEKNLEVVDLLGFYEGLDKDLSAFAFSRYDQHPNLAAHEVLGRFLAAKVWDRESFRPVRQNCGPMKLPAGSREHGEATGGLVRH